MCAVLTAGKYPRDCEFRANLAHFHVDNATVVDNPLTICYLLYHSHGSCSSLNINDVDQV